MMPITDVGCTFSVFGIDLGFFWKCKAVAVGCFPVASSKCSIRNVTITLLYQESKSELLCEVAISYSLQKNFSNRVVPAKLL